MRIQYVDKSRHMGALEVMGQTDVHVEIGDGVLDAYRFIGHNNRVANGFDPHLVNSDLAAVC